MKKSEQFFGMVRNGKFGVFAPQRLEGKIVDLTGVQPDEAKSPGSAKVDLSQYEGKIIEVSGFDKGGWIYTARVVEEAGPVLSDFLRKVFCKGEEPKKQCALVIGHKKESPGEVNIKNNISEFEFNERLVDLIERKVKSTRVQKVYRRTYATLPADLNALAPDFIVSLHCNMGDGQESGSEVYYHHKSKRSGDLGRFLLKNITGCLGLPDRGVKAHTTEDKGGYLLRYTRSPIVIVEPIFIDNDDDVSTAIEKLDELADAYARALDQFSNQLELEADENLLAI